MDVDGSLPLCPAYFNLGFIALNSRAVEALGSHIAPITREVFRLTKSQMRCQIALTLAAYKVGADIGTLPAEYNAANDLRYLQHHQLQPRSDSRAPLFKDGRGQPFGDFHGQQNRRISRPPAI